MVDRTAQKKRPLASVRAKKKAQDQPPPSPIAETSRDTRPVVTADAIASALAAAEEAARTKVAKFPRLPLPRSEVWGPLRQAVHVLPAVERAAVMLAFLFELGAREAQDHELTGGA